MGVLCVYEMLICMCVSACVCCSPFARPRVTFLATHISPEQLVGHSSLFPFRRYSRRSPLGVVGYGKPPADCNCSNTAFFLREKMYVDYSTMVGLLVPQG